MTVPSPPPAPPSGPSTCLGPHLGRPLSLVCPDLYDYPEVSLACRAMGYGTGRAYSRSTVPWVAEAVGAPTWLSALQCTGAEASLFDCPRAR